MKKAVRRSSSTPVNASNPGQGFYCAPEWNHTATDICYERVLFNSPSFWGWNELEPNQITHSRKLRCRCLTSNFWTFQKKFDPNFKEEIEKIEKHLLMSSSTVCSCKDRTYGVRRLLSILMCLILCSVRILSFFQVSIFWQCCYTR